MVRRIETETRRNGLMRFFQRVLPQLAALAVFPLAGADLKPVAECIQDQIMNRFADRFGIITDYRGLNGEIVLPTPMECEQNIPNVKGYWTPIENGGFFTGLYLLGQCRRYETERTEKNRAVIRRLVSGLCKLQDVAKIPAFIARGVGGDGKCHYGSSSCDQFFPWVIGLDAYLDTDIPTAGERKALVRRLADAADELEKRNWSLPDEAAIFPSCGNLAAPAYHAAPRLLYFLHVLKKHTGDPHWSRLKEQFLKQKFSNGGTRLDKIAEGPGKMMSIWNCWWLVNDQYAVRRLHDAEQDPSVRKRLAASLKASAVAARPLVEFYKKFDPEKKLEFTPDWHKIITPGTLPQENGKEFQTLSRRQLSKWRKVSPAVAAEKEILLPAFSAAWIILLSGDKELIESVRSDLHRMIRLPDYTKLHYAAFFYAENLIHFLHGEI